MKEAQVSTGPLVRVTDVPMVQVEHPHHVVIKVVVSGCNPKDWKSPEWFGMTMNQGDDIAGIVHAVGNEITEFKVGDRVAAFHALRTPGGSWAEYARSWDWSVFHLPNNVTFEEAATIPLAAMTAAIGLYQRLELPHPWTKPKEDIPLIIYGASSAVGAFAVKLARISSIHPLICIAGKGSNFVEGLIVPEKGDKVIDYRQGDEAVVKAMRQALAGKQLCHAFDAVSDNGSWLNICKILDPIKGKITVVLPFKDYHGIPDTVSQSYTAVGNTHDEEGLKSGTRELAHVMLRLFGRGLRDGWFTAHPHEVVPGGLEGIEQALQNLKMGKNSAVKYVFRIAETPGIQR